MDTMLKIHREHMRFERLSNMPLGDAGHSERYHLQEYIANAPGVFFEELGQKLFLLGKEVTPSEVEKRRIDLLAVDPAGRSVVIELKLGNDEKHLLQALSYAAMVSKWTAHDFLNLLTDTQKEELGEFLDGSPEDLNSSQRVILIAEAFDYQVLITAEWLSEMCGINIACCRISLSVDEAGEYLTCSQILPAPELESQALRRGLARAASAAYRAPDWATILAGCRNEAVVEFFRERLSAAQHNRPAKWDIVYSEASGKKGWYVNVQQDGSRVLQIGRFNDDLTFWAEKISKPSTVRVRESDRRILVFKLFTKQDFETFQRIMETDGPRIHLLREAVDEQDSAESC